MSDEPRPTFRPAPAAAIDEPPVMPDGPLRRDRLDIAVAQILYATADIRSLLGGDRRAGPDHVRDAVRFIEWAARLVAHEGSRLDGPPPPGRVVRLSPRR